VKIIHCRKAIFVQVRGKIERAIGNLGGISEI